MAQNVIVQRKENQVTRSASYGYADVALNNREIWDLIDGLKQDRLSQASHLKIQQLYRQFLLYRNIMMTISVPAAWYLAGWLLVKPQTSWTRYRVLMVVPLAFPIAAVLRQVPMKRRLLTDILTQDGEDGSYIRSALRNAKPGLWSKVSRQLYYLGYEFPEMVQSQTTVQFPKTFYNINE